MSTDQSGYALFRRAVEERDTDAWAQIAAQYRPLLISWANRMQAAHASGEQCADLADLALERAWIALTPEHFHSFPNIAALLRYLHRCVQAAAIDALRTRRAHERRMQAFEQDAPASPELLALQRIDRQQLWQLIARLITSHTERVVLYERFVLDIPPRMIFARHPGLFGDILAVYTAIRNMCDRLRRNHELRQFYEGGMAA